MLCLTMREKLYEGMIDMENHLCLHDIGAYYDGSIRLVGSGKPGDSCC